MPTEMRDNKRGYARFISALLVGLVVGAAATRLMAAWRESAKVEVPAGWVKESDLPPGTLAGLSDEQKLKVLKVITERSAAAARSPAQQGRAQAQEDPRAVYRVPLDDSPVKGPADALVTIVEASDFECPFCKRAGPTLKQVEDTYKGKVRMVFKQNPLPFHPKALPAAMAAEEARAQGGDSRFWAMHDKLFAQAPALERADLEKAAQELGLNLAAFQRALDENKHKARIDRDQAEMRALGANGTPVFFINGRKITGALPFDAFKPVIDDELSKAEAMVKAGTKPREVYARIAEKGATAPVMLAGAAAPQQQQAPQGPTVGKVTVRADDAARGPAHAKVTLVLFSDFQCPFCSRVEPTMKKLEETYKTDLRIVWKNQPLPFHPNAMPAALAAEAARQQGKFWPMHDLMFSNQQQLGTGKYEEWAKQIGLDNDKFMAAVQSAQAKARIQEDMKLASSVGASGTPTSFVNCRAVVGALPFEAFKALVDDEVKKADGLLKKGAHLDGSFYDRICDENVKAAPTAPTPVAGAAPGENPTAPGAPVVVPVRADDPVKGNPQALVTIVEFSEFPCGFCSEVGPVLKQVEETYGNRVRRTWKHSIHAMLPEAMPSALAAEAAREQGKFWEMRDKLFEHPKELEAKDLEASAKAVGLDLDRFRKALEDPKLKARVEEDTALAAKLEFPGVPIFVINGVPLMGKQPFEQFKTVIDAQLKQAEKVARK